MSDLPGIGRARLLGFVAGCAACGGLALLIIVLVVGEGLFDVTARDQHNPLVGWAIHATMVRAEQRSARGVAPPARFTPQAVAAGARSYAADCAACHGAPGTARASWTTGLTPTPPYLIDAPRRWSAPELYGIVADGVKMTAMPAWSINRSRQDIWNIVAFLEALPNLSPRDYARLTSPPRAAENDDERFSSPRTWP